MMGARRERRGYQDSAVRAIEAALHGKRRVLAVGPTGCGKTTIASDVIERTRGGVLFVAHRYELIDQAWRRLAASGIESGVIMAQDERLRGGARTNEDARVQVASVQTLARRGVPDGVRLIVFDEAHRVMADSYQTIAAAAPRARVLGLTATPSRMDGRPLSAFFESMVEIAKPSDLYREGYLDRPITFAAPPEIRALLASRVDAVRTVAGDYEQGQLGAAVDSRVLVGNVVSEKMRLAPGRPCVVFACTVRHSQRVVDEFRARGVVAEHLDGTTPSEDRARILQALRSGQVEVVSNVDVLSEGWDLPSLGVVCVARPTKSLSRYLQMTGRVQRPYDDGPAPIVLDHGDNAVRLGVLPDDDVPWGEIWNLPTEEATSAASSRARAVLLCAGCQQAMPSGFSECPDCGLPTDRNRREKEEREARLAELRRPDRRSARRRGTVYERGGKLYISYYVDGSRRQRSTGLSVGREAEARDLLARAIAICGEATS